MTGGAPPAVPGAEPEPTPAKQVQVPVEEVLLDGLKETLRRTLLWLPRTHENHVYVVRVVRNYLRQRDPDGIREVAAKTRRILEEAWLDVAEEQLLVARRPLAWARIAQRHQEACQQGAVGFWSLLRLAPWALNTLDVAREVVPMARPRVLAGGCLLAMTTLVWLGVKRRPSADALCGAVRDFGRACSAIVQRARSGSALNRMGAGVL